MNRWLDVVRRVGWRRRMETVERDVTDELEHHLERRTTELMEGGADEATARKRAYAEFGDVAAARAELVGMDRRRVVRRAWGQAWTDIGLDALYALRSLRRQPAFALTLLLTLGVGVGATSAIFAVLDATLIAPLPYRDGDRLVGVWETYGGMGAGVSVPAGLSEASYPDFEDWRAQSNVFSGLEGYDPTNVTVSGADGSAMLRGARVSAGFFDLLGVAAVQGRTFRAGEDLPGGPAVVVLSERYVERALGGAPSIGRTLLIDGRGHEIVGVLPGGFHFAPAGDAEMWLPLDRSLETLRDRGDHWFNVVGRLADGATVESARANLSGIMQRLAVSFPQTNRGRDVRVVELRDEVNGAVRPVIVLLFAAVLVLLLIACANVAGLLLARSLARGHELAARAALGANRGRLARQVLTESLLVAFLGALLGVVLAHAGVAAFGAAVPDGVLAGMPQLREVRADGRMLLFAAGLSLLTGFGVGLAPAFTASRASGTAVLATAQRTTSGRRSVRLRDVLVAGELMLTVVLLIGAGLVGRSLLRLLQENPGFRTERVLTARVPLAGPAWTERAAQQRFFETLLDRLRSVPGVGDAGAVSNLPVTGGNTLTYRVEGEPEPEPGQVPEVIARGVAGDYFAALGIPLVAGRYLDARDDSTAPLAVLINESLARQHFPAADATGRRLRFRVMPETTWTIVGVVGDVKTGRLDAPAAPTAYYSHLQAAENRMTIVLRGDASPGTLVRAVRDHVRALDPLLPVYAVSTMDDVVSNSQAVFARRYPLILMGSFAAVALLLALVGVYGVISYIAAQGRRELGIRAALGATRAMLLGHVLRHGVLLASCGVAAGTILGLAFSRLLATTLYGIDAHDPVTYLASALLLGSAAVLASLIPAHRAAGVAPAVVLRSD